MADMEKDMEQGEELIDIYTLTDEETGEEIDFELLAEADIDGEHYVALAPLDEEAEEYVILKAVGDGEELDLISIEDDDEFERVEEYFNDKLFSEIDYDN